MNPDEPGLSDELRHKFPHLRVIKHKPILHTINGFGFSVYGQRDWDAETRTYVKTHCFCALFIPVLALGAYRVVEAGPRSWYFIGKEPLSPLARSWNGIVALLAVMLALNFGWQAHLASPEYQARQNLQAAATSLKNGQPLRAATIYLPLAQGRYYAAESREGLRASLEQCLQSDSPELVVGGLRVLAGLPSQLNQPAPLVPDAFQRGLSLVEKFKARNLDVALDILKSVTVLEPTNAAVKPLQIDLLKSAIAAKSDNTNRVVELALIYEADKRLDESVKVLLPYRQKLGATEGARILGQYLLQKGEYEEAYGLLFPYVQVRLDRLHGIEAAYSNTVAAGSERALADLNASRADRSFYENYKTASKAQKAAMVNNYIESHMRSDPVFKRVLAELKAANQVVPVALDLGIVQLNRAQNLTDAAARKAELEAAEKTFLAIRSFASDTDEYRLFLGQVYYWLGKSQEGQELFDQLLASNKRAYRTLMALARTLREVGEKTQARALTEEAYKNAAKDAEKFAAAALRAHLQTDVDDKITWLKKCDANESGIQIELNSALGEKALRDGQRELAAQYFRKAIAAYESAPKNAVILNNDGLVYLNLYLVTGDIADHNRGLALLQEAVSLSPGNSLVLMNTIHQLLTRAYMDVVGDAIRFDVIKESPDREMLNHLFNDEPQRRQIYQRFEEDDYWKKALAYLDKALLLAPKNVSLYWMGVSAQNGLRNLSELQKLQQRFQIASPDLAEPRQSLKDFYSGAKEQERMSQLTNEIQRLEGLLSASAVKDHPLSLEFVRVKLIESRQQLAADGAPVDSRKVLDEALAVYQLHQDSATLDCLIAAYFFQAHDELCRQSTDYARLAGQTRRALLPRLLMAVLLEGDNTALSPLIRKNPNVLKALELVKEQGRRFPSFRPVNDWALFRTVDPAEAGLAGRQLKADLASRLADEIQFELNPLSGRFVLEQVWTRKMSGDATGAAQLYQNALRDGVPLPPL
jgi:tetratricopeptide (TPR) repeat protein